MEGAEETNSRLRSLPRRKVGAKLIAYSFFAGAGGLDLGLQGAGIEIAVATDIEEWAEKTHKRNWPEVPFLREDIRKVKADDLLRLAKGRKPDLFVGGPPCQGFSTLGDKLSSDPRNLLFSDYARLVNELEPTAVLMENVPAFVRMYKGQYRDYVAETFSEMGYTVYHSILNAADYGAPQIRRRSLFFATRLQSPFSFPPPTHGDGGPKPYEMAGDWIMDLVSKGEEVPNHIPLSHSQKVIARYKLIPEGGRLPAPETLPKEIRRRTFGTTYHRIARNRPSLTLVPGNNAFPIHPTLNRSLTPREAARLQTFPDSFVFEGDRRTQCILVGNAVPPRMAKAVGKSIVAHFGGEITQSMAAMPLKEAGSSASSTGSRMERALPLAELARYSSEDGFVDFFSGAGGFFIGFAKSGWKPFLAVDIDPSVEKTHKFNFPSIPFSQGDLANPKFRNEIVERLGAGKLGVVVGGPPCQGFSIFGRRRFVNTRGYDPSKDPRNKLVFAFVELVERLRPRWFVMENVPGLASSAEGKVLDQVLARFADAGYRNSEHKVLNAADYGVPQLRKRLLIIGNRTGHIIPWPKKKFFPDPQEWQKPYRGAEEVLSDLAEPGSYAKYTCHVPMRHKPLLVERYKYIPEGGVLDVAALPKRLQKGYRTDVVKNYSHVFKRLHRNRPSITMVPGHNAFPIHPWLDRALTVREAARIQSFPDEMEFKGTRQEQCIQVGNAFPPLVAELIANHIRKAEANGWFPGKVPKSAYYSLIESSEERPATLADLVEARRA